MTQRLSAVERRETIIKVAKHLFAQNGFHGVSIDEIVKEVGVSPAILYRHFKSKDVLSAKYYNKAKKFSIEVAGIRKVTENKF